MKVVVVHREGGEGEGEDGCRKAREKVVLHIEALQMSACARKNTRKK